MYIEYMDLFNLSNLFIVLKRVNPIEAESHGSI